MRWKIEIEATEGDHRLLDDVLARLGARIVEGRYLTGPALDACDSAADVREAAGRIAASIDVASDYHVELHLRLRLGSVMVEVLPTGEVRHHVMTALHGAIAAVLQGAILSASGSVELSEEERKRQEELEYQARFRTALVRVQSAHTLQAAVDVQRLLAGELTPQTMGQIADVLDDHGGHELASDARWRRFHGSINHWQVFGDSARHRKKDWLPPKDPMTLDEARACIREVAERWLAKVADA